MMASGMNGTEDNMGLNGLKMMESGASAAFIDRHTLPRLQLNL